MAVDVRQPDQTPTPTADDQGTWLVADGKRRGAEEIGAFESLSFERQFVVVADDVAGPGDAGHVAARRHDNTAIFNGDISLAAELRRLPAGEGFSIEKALPPVRRRRLLS